MLGYLSGPTVTESCGCSALVEHMPHDLEVECLNLRRVLGFFSLEKQSYKTRNVYSYSFPVSYLVLS